MSCGKEGKRRSQLGFGCGIFGTYFEEPIGAFVARSTHSEAETVCTRAGWREEEIMCVHGVWSGGLNITVAC